MQIEQKTTPHIQGEIVLLDRVYFASFINFDFSVLVGCLFALYIFALPKLIAVLLDFLCVPPPPKKRCSEKLNCIIHGKEEKSWHL